MKRSNSLILAIAVLGSLLPLATMVGASAQVPSDTPLSAARQSDPVVLTGSNLPTWSAPADVTAEAPHTEGKQCEGFDENCTHNQYEDPDVSTGRALGVEGTPIDRLLGYRWDGEKFVQIPFQVDEMTQRYLSNNNSGFAFYSETDPHHTYIFDREGFRWTGEDPQNPCLARPKDGVENTPDPVQGLDTDDELVFMARDAGEPAPPDAPLPPGIEDSYQVAVTDPVNGRVTYAYVMKAAEGGPKPAFDETNGYVRYERDADADVFLYSQSSYSNYGAAPEGAYFDPETGECITSEPKQRRPGDQATITTPRYQFRYEGRWLMTELRVSNSEVGDWTYGNDLIDQWKARAFQQRPSGQTPCCGFEEEVNNWGGSSMLMGELAGPVRAIRETWGADSGTNVVRREIFYRDEIRFGAFLRVHPIPPVDGIYSQWDYNAGVVSTYYNPFNPDGVPIDGKNDERVGNSRIHAGPDGVSYCGEDQLSEAIGADDCSDPVTLGSPNEPDCQAFGQTPPEEICIYNDIDSPDPTFSGVNAGLNWEQVAGPNGTLVFRNAIKHYTPGGTAQALLAVPYYRDDACFDDGTGSNPGPHVHGRGVDGDEPRDSTWVDENGEIKPRECWDSANPEHVAALSGEEDNSHERFYQGSVGTHGVHILAIADSDNASTTLPLTEIDTEQRAVVLPGDPGNVGEQYGRHSEKPLVPLAIPENRPQSDRVDPAETNIEITGATSGQITDTVTLAARLTSSGEPVASKELTFTLRGEVVGSASTDADGVASLDVTLGPPAEETELIVSFAGDEAYADSSAAAPFTIQLEDSSMSLVLERSGPTYVATATLTESDTQGGLEDRTIRFTLNGTEVGSVVTDVNGNASFELHRSQAKKDDLVEAIFDGDDSYATSRAEQRIPQN